MPVLGWIDNVPRDADSILQMQLRHCECAAWEAHPGHLKVATKVRRQHVAIHCGAHQDYTELTALRQDAGKFILIIVRAI